MPRHKTPGTEYDEATKGELVGYIKATENISEAARALNIPYSSARNIWVHYSETGSVKNEQ